MLAKECDFFSIGSNDLIQYTIATERGNEKVAKLFTPLNPAVIRLFKIIIDNAHNNGIECTRNNSVSNRDRVNLTLSYHTC